ncbi:MAG TPA: hypothetical protein VKD67_13855 [Acidimicrobiales bacterium]|nr:hypothetical protein [Acidimicrobiales bacterium]
MPEVAGLVEPGFEPVREAFEANLAEGRDVGAAVAVDLHGRPVVDLCGGRFDLAASAWSSGSAFPSPKRFESRP